MLLETNVAACGTTFRNVSYDNVLDSELYILCMKEIILIIKDVFRDGCISMVTLFSCPGHGRAVSRQSVSLLAIQQALGKIFSLLEAAFLPEPFFPLLYTSSSSCSVNLLQNSFGLKIGFLLDLFPSLIICIFF